MRTRTLRMLMSAPPLLLSGAAAAATLRVPWDHATIQAGVDAAADGDTVRVAPGAYHDCTHADEDGTLNCVIVDKSIVLLADGSRENTVIDAEALGRVARFGSAAHPAEFRGFTVTGGRVTGSADGGGVLVGDGADVAITGCRIRGNTSLESGGSPAWAGVHGGGVGVVRAHATLVDTELWDNLTDSAGGGLAAVWSGATLIRCDVRRNRAGGGGGLAAYSGSLDVQGCTIAENVAGNGGGLWWAREDYRRAGRSVRDSRIIGNRANYRGGGLYLLFTSVSVSGTTLTGNSSGRTGGGACVESGGLLLEQCTVAGNAAAENGGGLAATYVEHWGGSIAARSSIVWGNCAPVCPEGDARFPFCDLWFESSDVDSGGVRGTIYYQGANLFADPLFCAAAPCDEAPTVEGKYSLESGSPCLAHPGAGRIGAAGKGCETVAVTPTSWAAVKALYR